MQIEKEILSIKKEKSSWGAPKIRELIKRKYPEVRTPAKSTIHALLDRNGLVRRRRRRRFKLQGTLLSKTHTPNDLWCADYKGEFMLGNKRYCYPLTITDYASRYLLACDGLETTKEVFAFGVFERAFKEYGLPARIRTDNGVPFSSPRALFGLSKLSVWWLRLGIHVERIKPGNPQENGRHERMHLTLKKEATKPASENFLQQQERFDSFQAEYNTQRPHQALGMKYPSEVYTRSSRPYRRPSTPTYPFHDLTLTVSHCGRICFNPNIALDARTKPQQIAADWLVKKSKRTGGGLRLFHKTRCGKMLRYDYALNACNPIGLAFTQASSSRSNA
jgi:transposase InsO family protein